jgi:hypothetical protein
MECCVCSCKDDHKDEILTTFCNHSICRICLNKWTNQCENKIFSCPVCRRKILPQQLLGMSGEDTYLVVYQDFVRFVDDCWKPFYVGEFGRMWKEEQHKKKQIKIQKRIKLQRLKEEKKKQEQTNKFIVQRKLSQKERRDKELQRDQEISKEIKLKNKQKRLELEKLLPEEEKETKSKTNRFKRKGSGRR